MRFSSPRTSSRTRAKAGITVAALAGLVVASGSGAALAQHSHHDAVAHHSDARVDSLMRGSYQASFDRLSGGSHHKQIRVLEEPSITGVAAVGRPLRADPGTYQPGSVTFDYQWLAGGDDIANATDASFTPGLKQVGKKISVLVTASKRGYRDVTLVSDQTKKIAAPSVSLIRKPRMSGVAKVGKTLSVDKGVWNVKVSLDYRWIDVTEHRVIRGADDSSFTPSAKYAGDKVAVLVTGSARGYLPAGTLVGPSDKIAKSHR